MAESAPQLWSGGAFVDDAWRHAETVDDMSDTGNVILPLEAFLALDTDARRAANGRFGVRLKPGEPVEKIADHLPEIPVIALEFPAFSDGRSFSKAEILRRRYSYAGKVRAVGQVLPDQLSHMLRVGFDELEVVHPISLKWLREGKVGGLGLYAQPSADGGVAGKYSWRRKPAN